MSQSKLVRYGDYCQDGESIIHFCSGRGVCCDLSCILGIGDVVVSPEAVRQDEEFFGKGGRKVYDDLIAEGWSPISGGQFAFLLTRGEGNTLEVMEPDRMGGYVPRLK